MFISENLYKIYLMQCRSCQKIRSIVLRWILTTSVFCNAENSHNNLFCWHWKFVFIFSHTGTRNQNVIIYKYGVTLYIHCIPDQHSCGAPNKLMQVVNSIEQCCSNSIRQYCSILLAAKEAIFCKRVPDWKYLLNKS